MIIFQLNTEDFNRLVWAIRNQKIMSIKNAQYWAELAKNLTAQKEARERGDFFQCAACFSQEGDSFTNQASVIESERSFMTFSEG